MGRVKRAIRYARNTMPGPDGVPSIAFKALGDHAINVIFSALDSLSQGDAAEFLQDAYRDPLEGQGHSFNLALLCCLPKKVSGVDETYGEYYTAGNTRPLALVNTDNRIMASAARLAWEPILENWVSKMQRGLLKGRVMLHNVLDVDFEAMKISLKIPSGALLMFDFSAAFPSVAHDFLFKSLRALGLPEQAIRFIHALYDNNRCNIMAGGGEYPGCDMEGGVRQGCPLSPLLFAVCVDILLRMLGKLPEAVFRARYFTLETNLKLIADLGITVDGILGSIAGNEPCPWSDKVQLTQKKQFQRTILERLKQINKPSFCNRIRKKLSRWDETPGGLIGPPGRYSPIIHRRLTLLKTLVPPRVAAAVLRTLWNGWCSHRRFRKRAHNSNHCLLGCGGDAEDSIEHYYHCPAVQKVGEDYLRLKVCNERALNLWLLNEYVLGIDRHLMCTALLIYGTHMATNWCRHRGDTVSVSLWTPLGNFTCKGPEETTRSCRSWIPIGANLFTILYNILLLLWTCGVNALLLLMRTMALTL